MAHQLTLSLPTLQETRQTGMALGGALERGALCLFFGEMAAGKTTLIKSICAGMGIPAENVISPTYTLVNIYPATPTVYHVDL
ncbi:MAG: tRNA (adenosine(37)-N6)-threonylcarbamoyltransferase complex ATPase subunit type 1 TsaE, partial [SAR324 cluster bacterium]|nr:tRNA (adenosine(37)-N6)-threonylcarbamoyltransferase complex ATPase subunit type 1 TsaE [SAR324 cluster bacterium]